MGPNLTLSPYYSYCFASDPTVPLGVWQYGCTVSEHEQPVPPKINFANGKAINLLDGIEPQDAVTVGQLVSKLDECITNTINQKFVSKIETNNQIIRGSLQLTKLKVSEIYEVQGLPEIANGIYSPAGFLYN